MYGPPKRYTTRRSNPENKEFYHKSVLLMLLHFSVQAEGHSSGPGRACDLSEDEKDPRNSVVFSLKNQVGGLARALQVFQVKILIYCVRAPYAYFWHLAKSEPSISGIDTICPASKSIPA
jgi:hypothetical protein